ncbi:MAG: FadR/GntR family transcriptional regulator [Gammaproteobacteria bacterium]
MAELTAIRQEKVYEAAMNQLVTLIEDGTFATGDRLPTERTLARQLSISRASVRQALTGLAAMGLVESRPGDGTYVTERRTDFTWRIDAASALEILEGRRAIESGTVRLAAERHTQRELTALREIVATMDEQVSDGVHPVDTDREFHRAIAAAAHNPVLLQAMDALAQQMSGPEWHRIKLWGLRGAEQTARIQGQHRHIFAAIEAGDADLAEALMKEHIDRIIDDVQSAKRSKRAAQ